MIWKYIISGNLEISSIVFWEKTGARKSLRSVLSDLDENLEYAINFSKNMKYSSCSLEFNWRNLNNWELFSFQLKESLPTHPIPIPTPASAHPCLGLMGACQTVFNNSLSNSQFQKVCTYILRNFALVGGGFSFPNQMLHALLLHALLIVVSRL